MICDGIGILLFVRKHKSELPAPKQQLFADNSRKVADIRTQFERLHQLGPKNGFFLKSWKSILAVTPRNIDQVKVEFTGLTGSRYLGSIGESPERLGS